MRLIYLSSVSIKRFFIFIALLVLIAVVFINRTPRETLNGIRQLTILLDPGHGGVDGGTHDRNGHLEKDINLAICLKMKDALCQSGLNVVLTRETDTDLAPYFPGRYGRHKRDLMARIRKARESGSHFLVSIHCDWSRNTRKRGSLVFYNRHSEESKHFADIVQSEINRFHHQTAKAHPGNFLIVSQSKTAGILVEVGFLSNPEESALLQEKAYRERLALAINRGILTYCRRYIK